MRTLPYDYARCKPTEPDSKCKNCLRWADLPQQTWGPRTAFFVANNSTDEHCSYTPIKEENT